MKQQIENIIKKNIESSLVGEHYLIDPSLIADEVLKVVVEKIEHHFYGANNPKVRDILQLLSEHLSPNKENKNNETN